jgi:hypothetical protein
MPPENVWSRSLDQTDPSIRLDAEAARGLTGFAVGVPDEPWPMRLVCSLATRWSPMLALLFFGRVALATLSFYVGWALIAR